MRNASVVSERMKRKVTDRGVVWKRKVWTTQHVNEKQGSSSVCTEYVYVHSTDISW